MVDDGRTDDGRTPDHGHPISSPCEPNGSGELTIVTNQKYCFDHGYIMIPERFKNLRKFCIQRKLFRCRTYFDTLQI